MVDVKKVLTYPFGDKNWVTKMILGSIPVINPFFSIGYVFEIFKQALDKKELALPEWDDWGGYLVKSLKLIVIYIIYMIIPFILFAIGGGFIAKGAMGGFDMATGMYTGVNYGMMAVGWFFYVIGGLVALVVGLIMPMALAHYAKNEENIGAVFQFGTIISKIFSIFSDYIVTILILFGLMVVLGIALSIVGFILALIHVLGWIVLFLLYFVVGFYVLLVSYPMFGEACSGAYEAAKAPAKKA
jgi:hypothetical protein